ncbi:MAG: gamma carbonic anhydrase family protein, partial [Promethearchaeota archaeon]
MKIYSIDGIKPKIDPEVSFLSENIIIIGDVEIGKGTVIFDNVVLEGNHAKIRIGNYTNIQSGTMVHGLVDSPTIIGDYNTIGHRCIIHGCKT